MVHYGLWTTDGTPTHLNTITFMEANFLILAFEEECQREIKIIRDCLFQYRQFSYTTRVYSFVICNNLYHFFLCQYQNNCSQLHSDFKTTSIWSYLISGFVKLIFFHLSQHMRSLAIKTLHVVYQFIFLSLFYEIITSNKCSKHYQISNT